MKKELEKTRPKMDFSGFELAFTRHMNQQKMTHYSIDDLKKFLNKKRPSKR